jgi:hypothetical protein
MYKLFNRYSIFNLVVIIISILVSFYYINRPIGFEEAENFYNLKHSDFWQGLYDSFYSLKSPLYTSILQFVDSKFSLDLYSARLISLVFGGLSTLLFWIYLVIATGNQRLALFGNCIFAFSGLMVFYTVSLTFHSLFMLVLVCSLILFYKNFGLKNTHNINLFYLFLYCLVTMVGVFVSPLYIIVLLCQLLVITLKKRQNFLLYHKVFLIIFAIHLVLPWLKLYSFALPTRFDLQSANYNVFVQISQLFFGVHEPNITNFLLNLWPVIVITFITSLRNIKHIFDRYVSHILLLIVGVFFVYLGSLLVSNFLETNYLFFLLPSLILVMSNVLYSKERIYNKFFRYIVLSGVVVGSFFQFFAVPSSQYYQEAFGFVSSISKKETLVLVAPDYTYYSANYNYNGVGDFGLLSTSSPLESLTTLIKPNHKSVIIVSQNNQISPAVSDFIKQKLPSEDKRVYGPKTFVIVYN